MIHVTLFSRECGAMKQIGEIRFFSLLIKVGDGYICVPPGIATFDDILGISDELRHLPQVHSGRVGEVEWREIIETRSEGAGEASRTRR